MQSVKGLRITWPSNKKMSVLNLRIKIKKAFEKKLVLVDNYVFKNCKTKSE
jgi:hypothetical protein